MKKLLVLAVQQAANAFGQNFYVTKQGIKRDYDLNKASYEYKVYQKDGIVYTENAKGEEIAKLELTKKASTSSKPGNATTKKTDKRPKQGRTEPSDS